MHSLDPPLSGIDGPDPVSGSAAADVMGSGSGSGSGIGVGPLRYGTCGDVPTDLISYPAYADTDAGEERKGDKLKLQGVGSGRPLALMPTRLCCYIGSREKPL